MVRLGQETLASGALSEEAMEDGIDCLARYAALARAAGAGVDHGGRDVRGAGGVERRTSSSGARARETGLRLAVISGEEEARLITRAVRADLPPSCDPLLVLDIGGGSTEVVVAKGEKILLAESLDLGAVRLTDLHVSSDPLSAKEKGLRSAVRSRLKRLREARRDARRSRRPSGRRARSSRSPQIAAHLAGRAGSGGGPQVAHAPGPPQGRRAPRLDDAQAEGRVGGLDADRGDIVTAGAILLDELVRRVRDRDASSRRNARCATRSSSSRRRPRAGAPASATCGASPFGGSPGGRACPRGPRRARARLRARALRPDARLHQLTALESEWLEHAAVLHDSGFPSPMRATTTTLTT